MPATAITLSLEARTCRKDPPYKLPAPWLACLQLREEYEERRIAEEQARKQQYEEEVAHMYRVRPHQIITGEVVVRPNASPVKERPQVGRKGVPGFLRTWVVHRGV